MPSKGFLKLKKEIEGLTDYKRGYFKDFYMGYIHGIHDYHKYGDITEEEGMELENLFNVKEHKRNKGVNYGELEKK